MTISEGKHTPQHLSYLAKNIAFVLSLEWRYTDWWTLHHVSRIPNPLPPSKPGPWPPLVRAVAAPSMSAPVPALGPVPDARPKSVTGVAPTFSLAPTRHVYHPPTLISFPTSATLQQLQLNKAMQLESLILDGPFELLPLISSLTQRTSPSSSFSFFSPSSSPLRKLVLKNTNCMRREVLDMSTLLNVSPNLEHFSLRTLATITTPDSKKLTNRIVKDDNTSPKDIGNHEVLYFKIRTLELDIRSLSASGLAWTIAHCPRLDHVTWTDYGLPNSGNNNSNNNNNNYPLGHNESSRLSTGLPSPPLSPQPHQLRFGDEGLMSLSQHSKRLTRLDIGCASAGVINSQALQLFLQQAVSLVHLRVRSGHIQVVDMVGLGAYRHDHHRDDRHNFSRHASDSMPKDDSWPHRMLIPWACHGLETLSISFATSVPVMSARFILPPATSSSDVVPVVVDIAPCETADVHNHYDEQHPAEQQEQLQKQQQQQHLLMHYVWAENIVYTQLSLLTKLQVLDIKSYFMRLTLGTGFEALKSLKDLREFSMSGPNVGAKHRMPGELTQDTSLSNAGLYNQTMDEWFDQNWPHVRSIQVATSIRQ
ncbi:hypothetical protein BGZ94_003616 [Podila epigama]|nr:hypothetical protein BGZ94_003616 [Podila epigama]